MSFLRTLSPFFWGTWSIFVMAGCATPETAESSAKPVTGDSLRRSGTPQGTAWLKNVKKSADGSEVIVDSNYQKAHYAPDGNGGFYFAYWIIYYRDDTNSCYFWDTINAKAFTQTGDAQYCGQPPGVQVFYTTHIKNSDIVK